MKRGRLACGADILREVIKYPKRSPTRILASSGVNYTFLDLIIKSNLAKIITQKRKRRLQVTQRGREFLRCYTCCERLFPN